MRAGRNIKELNDLKWLFIKNLIPSIVIMIAIGDWSRITQKQKRNECDWWRINSACRRVTTRDLATWTFFQVWPIGFFEQKGKSRSFAGDLHSRIRHVAKRLSLFAKELESKMALQEFGRERRKHTRTPSQWLTRKL